MLFTHLARAGVLNCNAEFQGLTPIKIETSAMNEMIYDQNKEEPLTYEIPDEVLEIAACTNCETLGNFTQWICTAVYFCPGA